MRAYGQSSGQTLTAELRGSMVDCDAEFERPRQAEPVNLGAWLPLMYQRAMLNGPGTLGN